jgi:hypothetical protein
LICDRFGCAISLLAAAKEKFPVFKKLAEVEKPAPTEDDEEEDEEEEEETTIPLVEQFRRIFFMPLVLEMDIEVITVLEK